MGQKNDNTHTSQDISDASIVEERGLLLKSELWSSIVYGVVHFFRSKIDTITQLSDTFVSSKYWKLFPVAVFATSVGIIWCLKEIEHESIVQNITKELENQLVEAIFPIQSRIQSYQQIEHWIHWFFESSERVWKKEFWTYIKSLDLAKNFPEISWTSISFYFPKNSIETHTDKTQYTQDYYAPVTYIEPFSGNNLHVFWYDNFSDTTREKAMRRSQEIYEPVLSAPVSLKQDIWGSTNPGFLLFYPLFKKDTLHDSFSERTENILGWTAVAFRFSELIKQASPNNFSNIDLRIYDGNTISKEKILFASQGPSVPVASFWSNVSKTIWIANREITFVVSPTRSLEKTLYYQSYLDIIVQSWALVTFLATLLSYIFVNARTKSLATIKNLKESAEKIMELATHDVLTGLPNRALFIAQFEQTISLTNRHKKTAALMFIDLDNFKYVNDTHGHQVGDELLKQVSQRMKNCIRGEDTIGRQGGDEFLIGIWNLKNPDDAATVAKNINDALAEAFNIQWNEVYIGSSVGIATYPNDSTDPEILLKFADMALYDVKENWKNGYQFYSSEMQKKAEEYQLITTSLHHAIDRKEFHLEFQPIIDTKSHEITSVESLLRWNHPELWNIPPSKFIPIAESNSDCIISIGKWTIYAACLQIVEWEKMGIYVPKIAVNLSARQFLSADLFSDITQILAETGVSPDKIGFEITENILFRDIDAAISIINKLSNYGFEISIDDFGTGNSNLSYLIKFNINKLKIDRSFIENINSENGKPLIKGLIGLAHNLNIQVVAEWIEDRGEFDLLTEMWCDQIQGYYVWRPKDAENTSSILIEGKWLNEKI